MTNPTSNDFQNGNGVQTNFNAQTVVPQSNGSVVVVGPQGNSGSTVVQSFNASGTPNSTFGSGGQVVTPPAANEQDFAAASNPSVTNGLYTAGTLNGDLVVSSYDASGNLDGSFGQGGHATADFGTANDTALAITTSGSGQIVAAGVSGQNLAFARFTANGQLDGTFGDGGKALFNIGSTSAAVNAVSVQSDGKIIAAGSNGASVILVRLNPDGSPDTSFGSNGLVVVAGLVARQDAGAAADRSIGFALAPDGSLLVANHNSANQLAVARLSSSGLLDASFGASGVATAAFGGNDDADSVLVEPSGTILAVGTTDAGGTPSLAVAAFDASGNLLPGFANAGKLTLAANVTSTTSSASPGIAHPNELHVGDLVLRAFGTLDSSGQLVAGVSGQSTSTTAAAPTTGTLHRLIVPGAAPEAPATLLGTFGAVGKKNVRYTLSTASGTKVIFSISGGSGSVYQASSGLDLVVNSGSGSPSLTITTRGGKNRLALQDLVVSGSLRNLNARTTDLSGTLAASGAIGSVTIGNISGRIASSSGAIGTINATSLSSAEILSGANMVSGGGTVMAALDASHFGPGVIGTVRISGSITDSFIGAGIMPADGAPLDGHDSSAGGISRIGTITARSADSVSRFAAAQFGSVRIPRAVKPSSDPRFVLI